MNITIKINRNSHDKYYELTLYEDSSIWIHNQSGEGMELSENELFEILDKYFKEKF